MKLIKTTIKKISQNEIEVWLHNISNKELILDANRISVYLPIIN